ncbi:TetR family transcriptional regulator [Streptodolium elevatio]
MVREVRTSAPGEALACDHAPCPGTRAPQLLDAALLPFARDGIEAVSLREIRLAAGQRTAAATQYHFGTKEGLVQALVQDVLPPLVAHRRELLRGATVDDVSAVAQVVVAPLTALGTRWGCGRRLSTRTPPGSAGSASPRWRTRS